jgi:hypothetical protein
VTTILANFVGKSVVSAITQTPASGPFDPLTVPPISLAETLTTGAALLSDTAKLRTIGNSHRLKIQFMLISKI